jgi:hypothetical protein
MIRTLDLCYTSVRILYGHVLLMFAQMTNATMKISEIWEKNTWNLSDEKKSFDIKHLGFSYLSLTF